jgi:rare lipoprotein A
MKRVLAALYVCAFLPFSLHSSAPAEAQTGIASYYKSGRLTANGERFNPNGFTAAHRFLKFGTLVRVTNLKTGRSIVVRINDRGPFVGNRIIDLSYTAAHKLQMTRAGTAFVEVEVITPETPAGSPAPVAQRIYLQAGAFGVAANAQALAERLRASGISGVAVAAPDATSGMHRVRVGPVADAASFDMLAECVGRLGVSTLLVTE